MIGTLAALYICAPWLIPTHDVGTSQQSGAKTDVRNLDKSASVQLPNVALAELTAELSRQTGLAIVPADYLKERRLSVFIARAPARAILDSVCEMNGWQWTEGPGSQVVIDRPRPRWPRSIGDMATCLRDALNPEVRRFMGLQVAPSQRLTISNPGRARSFDPAEAHRFKMRERITRLSLSQEQEFMNALGSALADGKRHQFPTLDEGAQRSLVVILCLQALREVDFDFVDGRLRPFEAEPERTFLKMQGGRDLRIAHRHREGNSIVTTSMGASLDGPQPIKPP